MAKTDLSKISTRAPAKLDKERTKKKTAALLEELHELQNLMYAESKHSLLVIIQGMDASGKDGLIRDVFTAVNPLGIQVKSWKAPTTDELAHDFLWRIHEHCPAKGMIQLHNRSHYEDILVTRVHGLITDATARKRMKAINDFEWLLQEHADTSILKFYLHISREEQLSRLEERMKLPEKMWKYNANDLKESERWDSYRGYYEEAIQNCNQPAWQVIPSDQNWYKNFLVATEIVNTLKAFKMKFPGLKK